MDEKRVFVEKDGFLKDETFKKWEKGATLIKNANTMVKLKCKVPKNAVFQPQFGVLRIGKKS